MFTAKLSFIEISTIFGQTCQCYNTRYIVYTLQNIEFLNGARWLHKQFMEGKATL